MSTPPHLVRVVNPLDGFVFRMIPPVPSIPKGWNVVQVPPRAQGFRRSAAFMSFCVYKT
jgi:hypothetical protein